MLKDNTVSAGPPRGALTSASPPIRARLRTLAQIAGATLLAVAIGLGVGKVIAWVKEPPAGAASLVRYRIPVGDGLVLGGGGPETKATIVAYVDLQCPACAAAWKEIETYTQSRRGREVRFVIKDRPLSGHPTAVPAAEAVRAAREQREAKGRQMMTLLFEHPKEQSRADLDGYAQRIGLDARRFAAALDAGKFKEAVARDAAEADRFGVEGTPTFFINGRKIQGNWNIPTFDKLVGEEVDNARKLGVNPGDYEALTRNGLDRALPKPGEADPDALYRVPLGTAPAKGPADAKVTIVEYADFECPFCGRIEETLAKVLAAYPNDVRLVFKQHPLPFHEHAELAAQAALAAGEQGKFWPMHDALLQHQQALERTSLEAYAADLGLALGPFKEALDTGKFKAELEADAAEAKRFGAKGTPSFFVNGRYVSGAATFEALQKMIEEEIARAAQQLALGTAAGALYEALTREGKPGVDAPAWQ